MAVALPSITSVLHLMPASSDLPRHRMAPPPIKPRAHKVAQMNEQAASAREAGQRTRPLREKTSTYDAFERGWQTAKQREAGKTRLSSPPIKSKGEYWQAPDARPTRASFRSIPQARLQAIARSEHERSSGVPTRPSLVLSTHQAQNLPSKREDEDPEEEREKEKQRAKMSKALVTLMSKLDDPEKFTKLQDMLQRWRTQAS